MKKQKNQRVLALLTINVVAVTAVVLTTSATSHAEVNYGGAGCGLGTQVMGKDGNQVIVATINTTGMQSLAIAFGTSGCGVDDKPESKSNRVQNFIDINKLALKKDIARGDGETVKTLSYIFSCPNSNRVAQTLQKNFKDIFPENATSSESTATEISKLLANCRI